MNEVTRENTLHLAKGQFWRTTGGLLQVVDLGNNLVYYRVTRDRHGVALTRMLRRKAFEKQLVDSAAISVT